MNDIEETEIEILNDDCVVLIDKIDGEYYISLYRLFIESGEGFKDKDTALQYARKLAKDVGSRF